MPWEQEVDFKRKVAIYRKKVTEVSGSKYSFKCISTYMHVLKYVLIAISKIYLKMKNKSNLFLYSMID